jgi:1,4-dihydroxy-2-naphthoate octaprenyltransferase
MEFIVITSIYNVVAYTGGLWPLGYIRLGNFSIGYSGLGDIFVFLYFGLVATLTLPFVYVSCTAAASTTTDLESLLWDLFHMRSRLAH